MAVSLVELAISQDAVPRMSAPPTRNFDRAFTELRPVAAATAARIEKGLVCRRPTSPKIPGWPVHWEGARGSLASAIGKASERHANSGTHDVPEKVSHARIALAGTIVQFLADASGQGNAD